MGGSLSSLSIPSSSKYVLGPCSVSRLGFLHVDTMGIWTGHSMVGASTRLMPVVTSAAPPQLGQTPDLAQCPLGGRNRPRVRPATLGDGYSGTRWTGLTRGATGGQRWVENAS